ncbi:MAG: prepilin-type N-terminal cleavage/methylation domain-containing protein [Candidatus Omnitrophica bacterium]|nr:prepilin-type N-terminal cleavage/methylation domain-containing protein [Candidatus Omnitrophota bacterium]
MKKDKHNNKSGLTLMELIVAVILLSFVFLAIGGIDIGSRKLLRSIDKETMTLMDVSPAMQHMEKWVSLVTGDKNDLGVNLVSATEIKFKVDYSPADGSLNNTPEDYSDDVERSYYLNGNSLIYDPNTASAGDEETLATKVTSINFEAPFVQGLDGFYVKIELEALYDPTESQGIDNPIVKLGTNITPRCHSIN